MAKKRDDYLINLVVTTENLAEGGLADISKQLDDLDQQLKNIEQSEKKRTDTIRGQQRATADYSKENEKLIEQNKKAAVANKKETDSILEKAKAVDKQDLSFSNFYKNFEFGIKKIQRDIDKQKLDIDTTGIQASLIEVSDAINNVDQALGRELSDKEKKKLTAVKNRLVLLKKSYKQELENISLRKKALADEEKQIKTQESLAKAREDAENKARRFLGVQEQAIKLDRQIADADRKKAKAKKDLIILLSKEEQMTKSSASGRQKEIAVFEEWQENIKKAKRDLEQYGATQEEIIEIEENAARSTPERARRLAKARSDYAKAVARENQIGKESIDLSGEQITELELLSAKKEQARNDIEALGGSYSDLDRATARSSKETQKNIRTIDKLRDVLQKAKGDGEDGRRNPLFSFVIAFRDAGDEAGVLSRKLGRLGLAIRGLVIVGLLAFMQSFISVVGVLGAQITALISSILSASAAIGVSLVSAIAQAIPVVGLLAAVFSRISAIQEAVNQADLARKQAFGDTGAEEAATDAALQIADAQRAVKEAQEGVTEARKEAKKELQDLILKEKEAELAFKSATLSQAEARKALQETIASGDIESLARDQLSLEESIFDRTRARRELREARGARREGRRGGVEGTETYKNAVNALADAQRNLAQAQRSAASSADTQSAAQRNLAFFLNELSAAERQLFKQFMRIRERYDKVFRPITDIIIRSFSRGVSQAEKLIFSSGIVNGFRNLAVVLGNSLERVAAVLTGPQFKAFFIEMLGQAAKNMPLITSGFILLANIFKEIALAAGPAFRAVLEFIVEKLGEFNNTVSDTSAFSEFLMMGVEHFEAWIELIISILGLLGQIMQASSGSAIETISALTDTINGAKESLQADDTGARTFFDDAAQGMKEIGRVAVALGAAIVELTASAQVKALADIFTEMLIPGMVKGIKLVGLFALGLDKLLEIPIVAKMLQLGVSIFFVYSAFSAINAIFRPALKLITGIGSAFGINAVFIKKFVGNLSIVKSISEALSKAWLFSSKPAGMLGILRSIPTAIANSGGAFAVLRKGLAAIPVVGWIVVAVIEVIIGAIMALKDNFWGVTDAMKEALGGLGDAFNNLFAAFGGEGEGGGGFKLILDVLGKILSVIGDIVGFIGKVVGAIALFAIIKGIIEPITVVVNTIADAVNVWSTFVNDIKKDGLGEALKNLGKNALKYIYTLVGRVLALLLRLPILAVKGLIAAVKAIWSGIKGLTKLAVKGIIGLGKLIWNTLKFIFSPSSVISALGNVVSAMGDFFKSLPGAIWNILKAAGKAIWEGLILGLGAGTVEKIVNIFIDIVNAVIDSINAVSPFGDIEKLDEFKMPEKPSGGPKSKSDSAGRGRARDIDAETDSQNKNNKAKKDAAKFSLSNYKALNLTGKANKQNVKLNNQLANSLEKSSRQHKRAQNLQESLNRAAERGRRHQRLYADSVRQTARVEERYANSLARSRKIKSDSNDKDRASVRIRNNLADSTKNVSKVQTRYYNSTIRSAAAHQLFNKNVKQGNNLQENYAKRLNKSTDAAMDQRKGITRLSRRLGALNKVLQTTGENSRALGVVFKSVTNKILTEFNVAPLKIQLPTVSGMFKQAMGGTQNFQQGGYFGNKGMRGPDDRTIMVAGGEAILTGNHQAAVDTAFSIANQTAGFPYQNLDHMFNKDQRPHASAKRYNRGGKIPGYAKGGNILIPKNIPDAQGALPGLDLMAMILNKYFGLSVTSGLYGREGDLGSDHSWGGAIDVSNGSSPTSQMDSAWFWLTRVLGGAKAGGFIENYTSGAIKQMLYRTNIGGNHFNHIHLALLESYARNAGAVASILEGKSVPNANGAMFIAAPELKRPKIKGSKGSPKNMLQGQANKLTGAANKILKEKIQPLSGGISFKNMGNFDAINRIFPEQNSALGQWGGTVLPFNLVAALAQAAGMPGITFAQIAKGESGLRPGATGIDPGGTKGLGLWMITTGYNDELIAKFGGEAQMRNPVKNAMAAKKIYDSMGTGAWYGTKFVTDFNKPYRGRVPDMPHNRGGMIPEFNDGGIVPGPLGAPTLVKAHGGETILPTHKFNRGGMVPRYQAGGIVPDVADVINMGDVKNVGRRKRKGLANRIQVIAKKLRKAETAAQRIYFAEKMQELKDRLLLSKEMMAINRDIKSINKKIKEQKKKLKEADEEERKEIRKRLKELQRDLKEAKADKRATVAFEGETYNLRNVNEFVQLISDRLKSFLKNLEEVTRRLAIATTKWTFKALKIDGKTVITRTRTAVEEAQRGLADLFKEREEVFKAIRQSRRGEERARKRLRKLREQTSKRIDKFQNQIDEKREKLRRADSEEEKERLRKEIEEIQKKIEEERAQAQKDAQALQTSINENIEARKELIEREAELLASIYEKQQEIFEARLAEFENQVNKINTEIEIATLEFSSSAGNLSEEGKLAIRNLYEQIGQSLVGQGNFLRTELEGARAVNDVQRIAELEQALLENTLAILQNTQSINELDTALEDALAAISSEISMLDTQIEIVNLQFTSSAGNLSPDAKAIIEAILRERASALESQRVILEQQLAEATQENDTLLIAELQQALLDNTVAMLQNSNSIKELDTRLQDYLSEIDSRMSMFDTQIDIASLRFADDQGNISEEGRAVIRDIYEQRARVLEEKASVLREQLRIAMEENDLIRSRELEQSLAENELALLQNTKSIKELDGSISGIFDFRSTNWERFRQAVFTGSGPQLMPEFASTIPQLSSGGYITRSGLAYLHAAEVVVPANKTGNTGPLVDTINFTEPMEVADPIALSNQIGFKLSTLKSSQ